MAKLHGRETICLRNGFRELSRVNRTTEARTGSLQDEEDEDLLGMREVRQTGNETAVAKRKFC